MLVAGWGLTKSAGEPSEQLHYIEMPTADANLCKTNTKPEFHPYITSDKFCAGFFTGNQKNLVKVSPTAKIPPSQEGIL